MNVYIKLNVYKRAVLLGIDEGLPELVTRLLMCYMDEPRLLTNCMDEIEKKKKSE